MNENVTLAVNITQENQQLQKIAQQVLDKAKALGATAAEVGTNMGAGYSVTVRMGEVETIEYNRDKGLAVTVFFGQRKGSASSSDTTSESINASVEAACAIAKMTSEDDCSGLADKERMAWEYPDLNLYHPWDIEPQAALELAMTCEDHARSLDARISNSDGVSVATQLSTHVYANSHGFVGVLPASYHSLSCSLLAKQDDSMQRDFHYTCARDPKDMLAWREVAEVAANRTVRRLGGKPIPTCQVPVLFEAQVAGTLLRSFLSAISGGNLYRKASFLLDHLNKSVFAEHVCIKQQPHLTKALGSAPFDAEGVATQPIDFIKAGILQSYVLGSYSARKLGMQSTGNAGGVYNLSIDSGRLDFAGLLKKMDRGLLVTSVMGQGVNIVTGDYSRGASGFWIENGAIQYPVEQITIAGNLREMFQQLLEVGSDIDKRGNIRTGSILLENMTVAGQ